MKRLTALWIVLFLVSTLNITTSFAQDVSHIYWTDWERGSQNWFSGKIRRASLDGTNTEDIVTGLHAGVRSIALDVANQKMYWISTDLFAEAEKMWRANLDGTNTEDIVTGLHADARGIALDVANQKMYWTETDGAPKIRRANLDGTNTEDIVTGVYGGDVALDVVNQKMYYTVYVSEPLGDDIFSEDVIIRRANLDGTNTEDIVHRAYGGDIALDVAGGKIYYGTTYIIGESAQIRRANLDGTNDEHIVTGYPLDIALDVANRKIYWVDGDDETQKIQRANLDGTNIEDVIPTGLAHPTSIALGIAETTGGLRFSPNVIADQTFTVGTSVSLTLPEATGGTAPYTYTLTPQPPTGLYFDAATRVLSGMPTTATPATPYTYTATDATGTTASLTFTITVRDTPSLTDGYMYWTDTRTRKIQQANLNGTNVQDLVTTGLFTPIGIAVDMAGGKLYWTVSSDSNKIQRANLDGSNVEDLITGLPEPVAIAVDGTGGKVYWTDTYDGKIQRANLDGSNVEDLIIGLNSPHGIALDVAAGKIYWTNYGEDLIQRANLDGSNVEDIVRGLHIPRGIALDVAAGKIYWVDQGRDNLFGNMNIGKIQRANLNGSNLEDLVGGLWAPYGIALDVEGGKIYWTDYGEALIQRANLDGSNVEDIVTGLDEPLGIALGIRQTTSGLRFTPTTIADQTFTVGTSVSVTLPEATGGTPPYTYTLTPQPLTGLYFDAATRILSGIPTTATPTTTYTYTATDATGAFATLTFTITVTDTGPGPGGNLDVNADGQVNVLDLILVAVFYGTRGNGLPADVNADGIVNVLDFAAVAAGVDAAGGLPLQAVEAALLAAAAQAGDIEAIAGAPVRFGNPHQYTWSRQVAYHNVAAALADIRHLAASDARFGKGAALLAKLLQLLKEMNAIPETTALLPNYPNPFNPETWIPYHLATGADVTVTIYNVQGDVVRTLMLGHQPAGVYESRGRAAYWDGRNALGEPVASGLYFYTLTAGDFTATRKLLIAK